MSGDAAREDDDRQTTSPWTRPWFLASAALVAVLVIAGGWLLATDPPRSGGSAQVGAGTAPTSGGEQETVSVCGMAGGDDQVPTEAPATSWQLMAGFAVPSSALAGPGKVDESGVRWCYARSPWGAVLAAANFLGAQFDHTRIVGTLERGALPSDARAQMLAQARSLDAEAFTQAVAASRVQVAGYRVTGYTDGTALVDLLVKDTGGTLMSAPVPLAWSGGDWLVDVSVDTGQAWGVVTDPTGYVLWSGAA